MAIEIPAHESSNRELKQRRRRGRRLVKNECIFYLRNSRLSRFVRYFNGSKSMLKLNMHRQRSIPNGNTKQPSSPTFRRRRTTWSFHVVLQRTAKKCTKIYNARAQLLFCSLNLLFGTVLVEVVVVVCLSSLMASSNRLRRPWRVSPARVRFIN